MAADTSPNDKDFGEQLADVDEAIRGRAFDRLAELSASSGLGESVDLSAAAACLERLEQLWPRNSDGVEKPGESTLGDYRLIREVGRGGVVYEAEQLSLSRRVALKVLPFASVLDDRQIQRFKNESLAAAQLDHPHIVHVHGTGCERGVHYYAMQFIEGHTLADAVAEMRRLESAANEFGEKSNDSATAPATDKSNETSPAALLSTEHAPSSRGYFDRIAEIGVQIRRHNATGSAGSCGR